MQLYPTHILKLIRLMVVVSLALKAVRGFSNKLQIILSSGESKQGQQNMYICILGFAFTASFMSNKNAKIITFQNLLMHSEKDHFNTYQHIHNLLST